MATAPEDLILPFSITALILRCIYSLERDFNRILREYRLLRALSYDKVRLSNSEAEIDMRARDLWKLEDHPKMTVLLDPAEVDWMDIAECVVSRATVFIDRFEKYKERRKKPAVAAVRYIWTLNNYFIKDALSFEMKQIKEEINAHLKKNVDICGTLERSRTQIRSLQDRPIEHESISHRENVCSAADLVSSIVQKIDHQIAIKPYSVYGLTEKIELIKLQLLLLGAFMKDLEGVEFLSETEKVWVEEHKEIIDEAQRAIESFIHRRGGWFSTFSNLMARRKLKGDMKIIDAAFSDLYRRKERYGFKFIRRDQISKFDTRSPNEEEIQIKNKVKGIEDKKHYWLKQLPVSLTGEGDQVKFLSMMCVPWEKMHRLTEEVIAIEGVDNFRRTWLMQMKCTVDVVEETIEAYIKDEAARNTDYTSFGDSFFAYDPHSNVNSFFTGLPDYFLLYKSTYDRRHEVSVEIERMWQVINCFERTIKAYQIEIREESTSVVGLKEDIGVLISRLTNREPVVSIVGMRGIGKTTLAKKVFNHEVILKQFHNNRYWVSIGHKSLLNKIEMLVLGVLESQEEQRGREYWIKELRHFLGEERYLLVLEDINTKETWDTLKAAFPATTNGSTIMLTTRHKSVASHADQSSTQHVLRLRTKEESWKLFTQMVHLPPEIPPESEKIIKAKVVGRCGGLPLAIFHSGYRLIGEHVTQENSSTVLESINCYQESWIEAVGNEEFPVQLVKCLSYIRLFPRDYEIPARRVAASWVAEELLQQRAEDSPECVAEKCLADLKNRYIIQVLETKPDGKIKTFCLHYALSERLPNESSVQRLADYGKDEISQLDLREYRNLVTFLSFDVQEGNKPGENIGNFLQRGIATGCFHLLKVLDLERAFRPILPKKIGNLINLRYLGLRWTYLEAIPSSIGNLKNLQILDVKHTYIRKLPGSIWKLQKLRHLYLNQRYRSKFVQPSGAALKNLQTLWGVFVDEDSPLTNGLNRLMNLRKLKLAFQLELSRRKVLAEWISQLNHLQSLWLKSIGEMGEPLDLYLKPLSNLRNLSSLYLFGRLENPSIMEHLPQSLTEVTLSASQLSDDPMPKLGKLPNLRSLCLYSGSYKGTTMVCSIDDFPQLLVLKLWMLDTLQRWDVQERAMRNLRELEIRSCNELEIPTGLTCLETLQELKLTNMPEDFNIKIQNNFTEAEEQYPDKLFTPSIMIKY
nr:putative disease resistance rpp8-like protein 2 [Quercus suber]